MTKIIDIMDEEFDPAELMPVEISDLLEENFERYDKISKHDRKRFRNAYNNLVTTLHDKLGYKQFHYLK